MTKPWVREREYTARRNAKDQAAALAMTPEQFALWRLERQANNPIWTQRYAALWLGVSVRSVKRWEAGDGPVPTYVTNRIFEFERMAAMLCHLTKAPLYTPDWVSEL